jgi:rhodanese-related sulfurtransferase
LSDISVAELAQWRATGKDFVLLDVRNGDEIAAASLPDIVHIAMHEIPLRLNELPQDKPIAVLCHHGARSERVAGFLASRGFEGVVNVDGGIDAYARQVDPSLPRY